MYVCMYICTECYEQKLSCLVSYHSKKFCWMYYTTWLWATPVENVRSGLYRNRVMQVINQLNFKKVDSKGCLKMKVTAKMSIQSKKAWKFEIGIKKWCIYHPRHPIAQLTKLPNTLTQWRNPLHMYHCLGGAIFVTWLVWQLILVNPIEPPCMCIPPHTTTGTHNTEKLTCNWVATIH